MDYYQGVVSEYLRANRATFINTEFCIQIEPGDKGITKDGHWFCDAVALSFAEKTICLCEISFAVKPVALRKRLLLWSNHWEKVKMAVLRDGELAAVLDDWQVKPWVFVPAIAQDKFQQWEAVASLQFQCKLTILEDTQPWNYRSWDREVKIEAVAAA